jgi:hypothetical protein
MCHLLDCHVHCVYVCTTEFINWIAVTINLSLLTYFVFFSPWTSIQLAVERACSSGKGYTLHVHTRTLLAALGNAGLPVKKLVRHRGPNSWKHWSLNTVVFSSCFWKEIRRVIDWLREIKNAHQWELEENSWRWNNMYRVMTVEPPSWNFGCQTQNIEIKMCVI